MFLYGIYSKMGLEWSGICLEAFFSVYHMPQALFFSPEKTCFLMFDIVIFSKSEFSSKTWFLGRWFGEISRKSCSYGSYGPFWFSVKSLFWYVFFHQNLRFWVKPTFPYFCKNEWIFLEQVSQMASFGSLIRTPFLDPLKKWTIF